MIPQNQEPERQPLPSLEDFFKDIPFGCRVLYAILACSLAVDFLQGFTSDKLLADAYQIFYYNYEMWRLLTASFCQTSLMMLVINIISLHTILPKLVHLPLPSNSA